MREYGIATWRAAMVRAGGAIHAQRRTASSGLFSAHAMPVEAMKLHQSAPLHPFPYHILCAALSPFVAEMGIPWPINLIANKLRVKWKLTPTEGGFKQTLTTLVISDTTTYVVSFLWKERLRFLPGGGMLAP
jgi:hypothetical protein